MITMKNAVILLPAVLLGFLLLSCRKNGQKLVREVAGHKDHFPDSIWFEYSDITGIGYEVGLSRRDPGDIIKAGDTCYIWYTKIPAVLKGTS